MISFHAHGSKRVQPTVEDTVLDVSNDLNGTEGGTEPVLQPCHSTTNTNNTNNTAAYEDALLQRVPYQIECNTAAMD